MSAKYLGACCALSFMMSAGPGIAVAEHHARTEPLRITVSCARYAWEGVIWDRPMGVFLDDLTAAGYSTERAYAIGQRVCRDERYVGDPEAMGEAMRAILVSEPPPRR